MKLVERCHRLQIAAKLQVMMNHMRLETALHENHEGRNIAFTLADLDDLGPHEGPDLGVLPDMALEGDSDFACRRLLPREMRIEIARQVRHQLQRGTMISLDCKKGLLDLAHLVEKTFVLAVHLGNASQQFGRNEAFTDWQVTLVFSTLCFMAPWSAAMQRPA